MFERAEIKLRDARTALERMRTLVGSPQETNMRIISGLSGVSGKSIGIRDPIIYSETFSSCIAQVRSVGDAVLKEKKLEMVLGFHSWKATKIRECKHDDLLKFVNDTRNADLHNGLCPLAFMMHITRLTNQAGSAPFPGALLRVDGTGPYWIINQGTPLERRVQYESQEGYVYTVAITNPPMTHLGRLLPANDPVTVCSLAETYYAELLFEARSTFDR